MLELEGATCLRGSLMAIAEALDSPSVDAWLRRAVDGGFDTVVFSTGEGVSSLVAAARRSHLEPPFREALTRTHLVACGPQPACALHDLGLRVAVRATAATPEAMVASLGSRRFEGRQVGLQLSDEDRGRNLVRLFEEAGARVHPVVPYHFVPATPELTVHELIEQIGRGDLDAIVFTSAVQIERLFQVAQRLDLELLLRAGLARLHTAAVGPAATACLQRLGVHVDTVPPRQFFMRRLIDSLAEQLGPARR
jgi:uroporphyrinogen-III synthase